MITGHSQKRYFGKYKDLKRYWGDEYIFKPDFTFAYKGHNKTNGHIEFSDSSSGNYTMTGDTVRLNYLTNNYQPLLSDSPQDSIKWEVTNSYGYFGNRPQKLYWEKKRLYYIIETTGEIFRHKEHHMTYIK